MAALAAKNYLRRISSWFVGQHRPHAIWPLKLSGALQMKETRTSEQEGVRNCCRRVYLHLKHVGEFYQNQNSFYKFLILLY